MILGEYLLQKNNMQKNSFLQSPWDSIIVGHNWPPKKFYKTVFFTVILCFLFPIILFFWVSFLFLYVNDFFKTRKIDYKNIIQKYPNSFLFFSIIILNQIFKNNLNHTRKILKAIWDKTPENVYHILWEIKKNKYVFEKQSSENKALPTHKNQETPTYTPNSKIKKKTQSKITPQTENPKANSQTKSIWDSYSSVSEDFKNMNSR